MIAKEVSGAPLIVHVHATEFDRSGEHSGNPLVHEIEQQGLMMADRIIAVSHITKDMIVKNYHIRNLYRSIGKISFSHSKNLLFL